MKTLIKAAAIGFVLIFNIQPSNGQVHLGVDIANRYVWRGADFGDSPSIQPTLYYEYEGTEKLSFDGGVWVAYPFSAQSAEVTEHNYWFGAGYEAGSNSIYFEFRDYYFPNEGVDFFAENAHTGEISLNYSFNKRLNLFIARFIFNDEDNSTYARIGYEFNVGDQAVSVQPFIGGTTSKSALYGTRNADILELGLNVEKTVKITEGFEMPLFSSFVVNPSSERSFLVFGVSVLW